MWCTFWLILYALFIFYSVTGATVISRANQSKAVQEWKAAADEEYVEFVADEHEVPTFVNVSGKTITFKKTGTAADKALPTVTYTVASTDNKDTVTVTGDPLPSFVVLDAENKVYFIWNTNGTYAVVSTNTALGTSASMAYSFTPDAVENDNILFRRCASNIIIWWCNILCCKSTN